ncbi:unnamed protein product [Urochloa humidicola]
MASRPSAPDEPGDLPIRTTVVPSVPQLPMDTVPSHPQVQDVGTSGVPHPITSSATKRKKRPPSATQRKSTKRFKPPLTGNMLKSPLVTRSPVVTPVIGAPMMRLVVSPEVMRSPTSLAAAPSASLAVERSPSPSASLAVERSPSPSRFLDEETTLPDSTSGQSKLRRLRSDIWKDMDPIYQDGRVVQAHCKHCSEVFSAARNSGTSHMRRHLNVCEPRIKMHDMVKKLQSSVLSTETSVLTNWQFDKTVTRCELVRLIVLHELPFSFVEYEGFRSYSLSLNSLAESVSRTTIKENCMEAFRNQKILIRDVLRDCSCRFSLTADLWTSNQNTSYMVVTCHYIDEDWKIQKRIIRFCVVNTPHDGCNLYSVMLRTIRYYKIEDKLFSITLDNASANKTMMDLLRAKLNSKSMLHCNGDLFHVSCAAHVLNLIVKDGLESIDGVIHDIRESVKYVKASTSRKEKFEEIIREIGTNVESRPSLDVPTQWNSTYDMLESAFPFEDAFRELQKQEPHYFYCPTPEQWQKANAVCKLLKVFKKATKVVSGTRYPTSNLYLHQIWNVREVLKSTSSSRNPVIEAMVSGMRAKFDKYWEISYLSNCIPVILDPRFKLEFIEFRMKKAFGDTAIAQISKIDEAVRALFSGYSSEMADDTATSTHANDNATLGKGSSWSDWSKHISTQRKQVTGELDRYLCDDLFPCDEDDFDVLYWWKMHTSKYPILARMARDVLAAPASTVASEFAFSTSGRIINDHRTRLSGNTVEALICFQDWLREAGESYLDIINISSSNEEEVGAA